MQDVRLDARDMKTRPCSHCEAVIQEMVNGADPEYEFVIDDDEVFQEEEIVIEVS